jgi:hypothetical protein
VLTCTFVAVLLVFWLSMLDEMRVAAGAGAAFTSASSALSSVFSAERGGGRNDAACFYAPKLALVCSIWSILISTFIYIRTERKGDPTYEGLDDWVLRNVYVVDETKRVHCSLNFDG